MTALKTLNLFPGQVLTVVADAVSSGSVVRLSDTAGNDPYAPTAVTANATVVLGPFNAVRRYAVYSDDGSLTVTVGVPAQAQVANVVALTATAMPAGGTGAAAGAWDTAQHRDDAIAAFAALLADVVVIRTQLNALLAQARLSGDIAP